MVKRKLTEKEKQEAWISAVNNAVYTVGTQENIDSEFTDFITAYLPTVEGLANLLYDLNLKGPSPIAIEVEKL